GLYALAPAAGRIERDDSIVHGPSPRNDPAGPGLSAAGSTDATALYGLPSAQGGRPLVTGTGAQDRCERLLRRPKTRGIAAAFDGSRGCDAGLYQSDSARARSPPVVERPV